MLRKVYTASFIFAFTLGLAAYINSSFLEQSIGPKNVGILFSVSSLLAVLSLETLPFLLTRFGNRKITTWAFIVSIIGFILILLFPHIPILIWSAFLLILPTNYIITYCFDIFSEHYQKKEGAGKVRGSYLSISNLAWLCAPFLAGVLIGSYGFFVLFGLITLVRLVGLMYELRSFKDYSDSPYLKESPFLSIKHVFANKNVALISIANFSLQLFYTWMVIFTPLYLQSVFGFSYAILGIIFTIMLVPFVILQYPLGTIADKFLGEKELLTFGFLIMAGATFVFGRLDTSSIIVISLVLFATRIGAATVEVMSESYFFSKIKESNIGSLSFFRLLPALAYIVGPITGSFIVQSVGYRGLFTVLSVILITVMFFSQEIKDTK